jgi:hypothetical protein
MKRRGFLGLLASLPLLRWIKPEKCFSKWGHKYCELLHGHEGWAHATVRARTS